MIKIELHGRLGNQLFQYAAARSLYEKNKGRILISYRTIKNEKDKEGLSGWEDALKFFNVLDYEKYSSNTPIIFYKTSLIQKIIIVLYYMSYKPILKFFPYNFNKLKKVQLFWAPLLSKFGIYWLKQGYFPLKFSKQNNYLLNGGFESPDYFSDIRNILLNEFSIKQPLTDSQHELVKKLRKMNSICISVRKFDLSSMERNKLYNVCTKQYYVQAIKEMLKVVENPVFYVCSNDIRWVKQNLDFSEYNVIYENEEYEPHIKLEIMKNCKHFIISNSTFSWWAQYLGEDKNKIVVAPKKWYNNDFESPLLTDKEWIYL